MQYRIMRQQCSEEQFVADPYVSSLNLFEELENRDTRSVDIYELTEYWNKNGINFEESFTVLKDCGESLITNGTVNTDRLSGYLEDELNKYLPTLNPTVKCAVVSLYRCLEYMKAQLRESEKNVAYFTKQLELANQRSTMLIEELDHNQWTIEQNCEKKLKELEEHQHMRIMELEERHEQEKLFMQKEITKLEEELTHSRQVKQSMRSRLILVERQNNRMSEENAELSANATRLEQHNAQLKADIIKIRQPDDSKQLVLWKQKVDLLVNHNKRLREKISELTAASQAKALEKNRKYADEEPSTSMAEAPSIWSPAFRSQVGLLRKRREAVMAKGNILDTASDIETEPEGIFFRQKQRRKLKRKDRYKRLSERKAIFEKMKANENGDNGLNRSDSASTFHNLDRRKRSLMENITSSLSATCSARARDSTTTSRPNSSSNFLNVSPRAALSFLDFGASARKRLNGK
ncbi:hypothetical protein WR25_03210 isoform D [Diploscapter pachys]|nr:hypothetical protein WR25_03210 isoform B [Diploscapter pachys]PAV79135.1 hypothetical protein WR25_03210 isoform C [Diploscapter pachys]PAV79136.1 hypothetical protein WR25_03210 isoform D [Diploscapter pachys]